MNNSFFGNAPFMGSPMNQDPFLTPIKMVYPVGFLGNQESQRVIPVEVHDEMNPYHVMGCKKCKRKKKKTPFSLPQGRIVYNG